MSGCNFLSTFDDGVEFFESFSSISELYGLDIGEFDNEDDDELE